jgi:TonB-linked SusC/RagA family outer membrane protein
LLKNKIVIVKLTQSKIIILILQHHFTKIFSHMYHFNIFTFRKWLIASFVVLTAGYVSSQKTVTGTVIDEANNEALIGVTVSSIEEPSKSSITDIDGKFTLSVSNETKSIKLVYVGYVDKIFDVSNSPDGIYAMSEGELLEELVIVGYGTVKREDLTGSIQTVTSDKFNKGAITGAQELLAGKVAGVSITTDGGPGSGARIRIRGESSISASNDPLIVIDGIPVDNGAVSGSRNVLNIVNPNDIESMTVLKDASATAIYGNRASAGVILITTKKGKVGSKLSVNYNANFSVGSKYNTVDMLSPEEYADYINGRYFDATKPADQQHPAIKLLGNQPTNWQDLIYQNAPGMEHNLSFSGAEGNIPYRVSVGFTDKDGILKTDNFKRYVAGINLNPSFFDNKLQVNVHLKVMDNDNHFADRGAIGNALNFDPTRGPYDVNSRFAGYTAWTVANGNPNNIAPTNPIALLDQRNDNSRAKQYITNANISYRLPWIQGLIANLNIGNDHSRGQGRVIVPNTAAFAFDAINGGGVNNFYRQRKNNSILESFLNYKRDFNKHGIDLMGGYSWQRFEVSNFFLNSDSNGSPAETSFGKDPAELFLISLYSRLNYDFNDRYFATFSLRRDGASRFSPETRWGLFPAAALAVKVVDNENKFFNQLKVRGGWGITGQQDIGDYYAYLARYQLSNPNARYQFGNEFIETYRPNGYDANIKWEETTTYNVAADFSIIKDKISGSVDVYKRLTKDILNEIPIAAGTNLTNFITTNVGTMENRGIEFTLNTTPIKGWDLSANIAFNDPKITKLTAIDDPSFIGRRIGGIAGGVGSTIQIHTVGFAPNSFYVYKQLYDENGKILPGQYADVNGDGAVNSSDFYRYQSPNPKYVLGLTSNYTINNFDFSFAGRANFGNYIYNNVQTDMGFLNRAFASNGVLWGLHQSAIDNNAMDQANLTFSDHFVRNASFFRLDHVTLGYNFPTLFKGLRLFATVQNPVVITNYDGLDPEVAGGIDNNIYPRPRTYLGGLSVTF